MEFETVLGLERIGHLLRIGRQGKLAAGAVAVSPHRFGLAKNKIKILSKDSSYRQSTNLKECLGAILEYYYWGCE